MRDASAVAPAVVRPEPMEPQTARSRSPVPICAHLESTLLRAVAAA
jgi:hypothetical protein